MWISLVALSSLFMATAVLSWTPVALPRIKQGTSKATQPPIGDSSRISTNKADSFSSSAAYDQTFISNRRSFMSILTGCSLLVTVAASSSPAHALPMVTSDEFDIILRDSARSIEQVEFSGPRSETVTVRLMDGTAFGIQGVVESSTDPRSPLKIAAACKSNLVPAHFVDIENVLAASPRKKKVYTNSRVLEAAVRQEEKKVRLQQDEELRQAEWAEMRGQ